MALVISDRLFYLPTFDRTDYRYLKPPLSMPYILLSATHLFVDV